MKKNCLLILILALITTISLYGQELNNTGVLQFIFTSDAHYGIARMKFRGDSLVDAHWVNKAMIKKMNTLGSILLPADSGIQALQPVGPIDFLIEGGDIANRMEIPVQSAKKSWKQFKTDYLHGLKLTGHNGKPAKIYLIAGNHDITNAVGFYKPMSPLKDPSSMINIFNLMMKPAIPLTSKTYQYDTNKIHYSFDMAGIHFMFLQLWPDSAERKWMQNDQLAVSANTPVIIFSHDQPESEAKHFSNPNAPYDINNTDKFEDLLAERYKDDQHFTSENSSTDQEQIGWAAFLHLHPNIKAYFHGNSNYQEAYLYKGPKNDIALPVFRVDSPIKGRFSSKDEKLLSFQLVTIDIKSKVMTVRECLWNTDPKHPAMPIKWGASNTIPL